MVCRVKKCNVPLTCFINVKKNTFLLQGCEDGITLIADNPFINKKELCPFEKGIRIDYILFKVMKALCLYFCIFIHLCLQQDSEFVMWPFFCSQGSSKTDIYCDFMSTTKGSVPDHPFPYSDHEALTAGLRLETDTPTETGSDRQSKTQDSTAGMLCLPAMLAGWFSLSLYLNSYGWIA